MSHPILWARYVYRHEFRHEDLRFIDNPRFVDWSPMYRVCRSEIARLAGRSVLEIDRFYRELDPLHRQIWAEVGSLPGAGALMQGPMLYLIVRATRPSVMIETGVSSGFSSRLILEAMEANGAGELHSIGVAQLAEGRPAAELQRALAGRSIGWLVTDKLRARWHLHVGKSDDLLPGLLAQVGRPIDAFLHDSRHQYDTMTWEYTTAFPAISPGGLLLSHDVHTCAAWPDFLRAHALTGDAELDHDLGGVRVNLPSPAIAR